MGCRDEARFSGAVASLLVGAGGTMTDQVLPASRVDRLDPLNQTGTSNPDQTFFSLVSAASWSHSTAEVVSNPAASTRRSSPPAPEKSERAEPTFTAPVCTVS